MFSESTRVHIPVCVTLVLSPSLFSTNAPSVGLVNDTLPYI